MEELSTTCLTAVLKGFQRFLPQTDRREFSLELGRILTAL